MVPSTNPILSFFLQPCYTYINRIQRITLKPTLATRLHIKCVCFICSITSLIEAHTACIRQWYWLLSISTSGGGLCSPPSRLQSGLQLRHRIQRPGDGALFPCWHDKVSPRKRRPLSYCRVNCLQRTCVSDGHVSNFVDI